VNEWLTITVTTAVGYVNVYRRPQGLDAQPAPAILLQQSPDGQRRAIFAVLAGAELIPATDINGYVSTVEADDWQTQVAMRGIPG
jgi:hypothetical protein